MQGYISTYVHASDGSLRSADLVGWVSGLFFSSSGSWGNGSPLDRIITIYITYLLGTYVVVAPMVLSTLGRPHGILNAVLSGEKQALDRK